MPRAGYCSECATNVWLLEDGSCAAGHEAACITAIYEAESAQPPAESPPLARKRRRWPFVLIGVAVLLVLAACALVSVVANPLAKTGSSLAAEWKTRLAKDYPGWRVTGFNVRSFSDGGGSQTEYTVAMVPPGRDFSVGVLYISEDGAPPESQDVIFRPAGQFSSRAGSLLDLIERQYIDDGRAVVAVTSQEDGNVQVNWLREKRVGPFYSRVGNYDDLVFSDATGTWQPDPSP